MQVQKTARTWARHPNDPCAADGSRGLGTSKPMFQDSTAITNTVGISPVGLARAEHHGRETTLIGECGSRLEAKFSEFCKTAPQKDMVEA